VCSARQGTQADADAVAHDRVLLVVVVVIGQNRGPAVAEVCVGVGAGKDSTISLPIQHGHA
jgi:hypothetical protein